MTVGTAEPARSPKVRELHDYWRAKRGSRRMPSRADIDPAEIKPLLPYVILADMRHDPLRVFFRLVGTGIVGAAKCDLTGHWLHEIDLDGNTPAWERIYRRVAGARAPVFGSTRATMPMGGDRRFDWVVLPLSADGESVNMTLELEDWEGLRHMSEADKAASTWRLEPLP
jgi:hypothetical protein